MRFNHPNSINVNQNFGFTLPVPTKSTFVRNGNGQLVLINSEDQNNDQSFQVDMNELQQRIQNHNWYYHLHRDLNVYNSGYHNEQAILNIVNRRGGIFSTIWETERRRRLSNV